MKNERLIRDIDRRIEQKHLLTHPFYKTWSAGALTKNALSAYSCQYYRQVEAFPLYLGAVYSKCDDVAVRRTVLRNLIEEDWGDNNHLELWLRFAEGLGLTRGDVLLSQPYPETVASVCALREVTAISHPAAGMAAIYAYEAMVPEVSATKIEGLKTHYGICDERPLSFFTVHEKADREHREWDKQIIDSLCDSERVADECKRAAQVALDSLWTLLDGVHSRYCATA